MTKITQINNRYVVETPDGRVHILNKKSLEWNLKYVFNYTKEHTRAVVVHLESHGKIGVAI